MKKIALIFLSVMGLFILPGCCEPECDTGCVVEPAPRCVVPAEVIAAPAPAPKPPPPPPPRPRPAPPPPQPPPPPVCDPCASFAPLSGPASLGGETIYLEPVEDRGEMAKR